ncbi:UNVERIFIED_CONTAM: putative endonuclease distantly related to archaeal Holliday junction resolvase and Mrr-like restriction enzymes [Acetivibrio alkalicellulosi]
MDDIRAYLSIMKAKEEEIKQSKERVEKNEKDRIEKEMRREEFKVEFIKYFNSLSFFYTRTKNYADEYQKLELQVKIQNDSLFDYIVNVMYEKIRGVNTMSTVSNLLCNVSFVKDLMNSTMKLTLPDSNYSIPDEIVVNQIETLISMCLKDNTDNFIFYSLLYSEKPFLEFFQGLLDSIDDNLHYTFNAIIKFFIIYSSAYGFIKSILYCRNFEKFSNNEELNTMFMNLRNNTEMELKVIIEKLYPIYQNYYTDTFSDEMTIQGFAVFLFLFDKNNLTNRNIISSLYHKEIIDFKNSINKDVCDFNETDCFNLNQKFINLLKIVNNEKYFEMTATPYDLNYEYIDGGYILFYQDILRLLGNYMPSRLFFKLYHDSYENSNILKRKQIDEAIKLERERLLKGDLSKEKQFTIDKYSFDNITSGYEFEVYLKTIFERLGYNVEVTKKSNDQGADLIIQKDTERIVVQAKFYSNPVGNKAVQEIVAAKAYYQSNKSMIVTNNTFTRSAIELAEVNDVTLIDGQQLSRIRSSILEDI